MADSGPLDAEDRDAIVVPHLRQQPSVCTASGGRHVIVFPSWDWHGAHVTCQSGVESHDGTGVGGCGRVWDVLQKRYSLE